MLLQSSCEDGALAAEQEHQRQADVIGGVAISYHLKEGGLLAITSLVVVLKRDRRSLFEAPPVIQQQLSPLCELVNALTYKDHTYCACFLQPASLCSKHAVPPEHQGNLPFDLLGISYLRACRVG